MTQADMEMITTLNNIEANWNNTAPDSSAL